MKLGAIDLHSSNNVALGSITSVCPTIYQRSSSNSHPIDVGLKAWLVVSTYNWVLAGRWTDGARAPSEQRQFNNMRELSTPTKTGAVD
jgi:hypothetical protein